MHRLLRRQIKKFFGEATDISSDLKGFLDVINASYEQADIDRALIERSLDIASQEMLEQNRALAAELKFRSDAESQLAHLTNFDSLTGLVNRTLLNDRLQQALAGAERGAKKVAVLVLGLDHFKAINDSLGRAAGNDLLKIMAHRLSECIRNSDTVARLGGDEFALVLIEQNEERAAATAQARQDNTNSFDPNLIEILTRILNAVSKTVLLADQDLQVTCSIGLSLYPQDGRSADALLQHADTALTSAKKLGRNNFQFYTSELSARTRERLAMLSKLRLALERDEFILHYQPQVDLRTGSIVGLEALIRWNQPDIGMVPPGRFIGLAEETGLIVPIGTWVIRTACLQSKAWEQAGCGPLRVAVNLSVRQFAQPDLVASITSILAETGLDPTYLEIELTESLVMTDVERSIDILRRLKALGVQLSIDDFGTGYSSLSYLQRFPIDVLKIDQTFVRDIKNSDDASIVKAIISLAHNLGIRVIAEGVETEAQCDFLRINSCDEIQGFFFSKGRPHDEICVMLHERRLLPDHLLHVSKCARVLLLVDDDTSILDALKRVSSRDDYVILTASSGQGGLALLAQHDVDVIISGNHIPDMKGVEFLRVAKHRSPDSVRIFLSDQTDRRAVIDAINEGTIYQFLNSPWDDSQLWRHVDEAFKRKEVKDENRRLNVDMHISSQELAQVNEQLNSRLAMQRHDLVREKITLDIVREALHQAPTPAIGLDEHGAVLFANEAARIFLAVHAILPGGEVDTLVEEILQATTLSHVDEYREILLRGKPLLVASIPMSKNAMSQSAWLTLKSKDD